MPMEEDCRFAIARRAGSEWDFVEDFVTECILEPVVWLAFVNRRDDRDPFDRLASLVDDEPSHPCACASM